VAFRLDLPSHYRIHNILHVSLLEVYHPSTLPGWQHTWPRASKQVSWDKYEV
jgi:hypothetical protein